MNKNLFFKHILCVFAIVSLASCDNDFNEIGTNIVGDDNFVLAEDVQNVVAYNQQTGAFQSNNLRVNQLGTYDNPVFGKTTANFVTQLTLALPNPTIGEQPHVRSVILTIPYYNRLASTDATTGDNTYTLDSIYGPEKSPMQLHIYESTKYLRNLDPVTQTDQVYFSNQHSLFTHKPTVLNSDAAVEQNEKFYFDPKQYKDTLVTNEVATYANGIPRMRLDLDKTAFQNILFSADAAGKLVTNDIFKEYCKGLYFEIQQSAALDPGQLAMLNFGGGKIVVKYNELTTATNDGDARVEKSLILNLTGNTVNLLDQVNSPNYANAIANPNRNTGDEKLYVKGGDGSMAVLELFKEPGKLAELKATKDKWLVNDASITFYIENSTTQGMGKVNASNPKGPAEPKRIYLYDLNNKNYLLDYYTDSSISTNLKFGKSTYGGIIDKLSSTERGTKYKIRITNQIRNLIETDTLTNVRLGLVVTEDINDPAVNLKQNSKAILSPYPVLPASQGFDNPFTINAIPNMSALSPLGTILWGTAPTVAEDKKIKLIIHYTKPN